MDYSKHLFRASSFGTLMAGKQGITKEEEKKIAELEAKKVSKKELTATQKAKYDILVVKETLSPAEGEALKKFQDKMNEDVGLSASETKKLESLIFRRDNTILSKGAKTYLRKLRREIKFKRRKKLKSKYLTKGVNLEEQAITFLSIWHDEVFTNNKERVNDEYFTGEVDVLEGYDTKCSYELDTLPDPLEPLDYIYEFQNRVYMKLHNRDSWTTSYILLNATDDEIAKMMYREAWELKIDDVPDYGKLQILNDYIYDEENFFRLCKFYDCIPDIKTYKELIEAGKEVPTDLEKAVDIFTNFTEIPDYERIVEKTTIRDLEIEQQMVDIAILAREYMQEVEDAMKK